MVGRGLGYALVVVSVGVKTGALGLLQIKTGSDINVLMLNKSTKNKGSCSMAHWPQGP